MWITLGLISCLFLGLYDIAKKHSLKDNSVLAVLLFASASSALLFVPVFIASRTGSIAAQHLLFIPKVDAHTHLLIFAKSILVGSSWIFAYLALKNLPITIVTPIRATGPVWTLLGALIIYHEVYNLWQWAGILTVLICFYLFSLAGQREGISFKGNKWVLYIFLATLIGSFSTLYDKFLMTHYHRMAIQSWFSVYMVVVFFPFYLIFDRWKKPAPFIWRWSIPLIGFLLTIADFAYFFALSEPESLVTILSVLRRSSVVVAFIGGAVLFGEGNLKRKGLALLGIFAGVLMLVLGG